MRVHRELREKQNAAALQRRERINQCATIDVVRCREGRRVLRQRRANLTLLLFVREYFADVVDDTGRLGA